MSRINSAVLEGAVEEICTVLLGGQFSATSGLVEGLPIVSCCITMIREAEPKESFMLLVNCDNNLLDAISESIFGEDVGQIELDDMFSALREVANMIGGEIIKIMEQDFDLGLPCTMEVSNEMPNVVPEDIMAQITLRKDEQYINVILTQF